MSILRFVVAVLLSMIAFIILYAVGNLAGLENDSVFAFIFLGAYYLGLVSRDN